jgi:hypothetical protein
MESTHAHNVSHTFRIWQYFRVGWATYFGLIFAALNTIITTYFLAIDNINFLEKIFPTFGHYVITVGVIGVPCLVIVGYVHTKRTAAYKEEAVVKAETNPHHMREVINSELLLVIVNNLNKLLIKKLNNIEFTKEEFNEMDILKEKLQIHTKNTTISDSILTDIDMIIKRENHE